MIHSFHSPFENIEKSNLFEFTTEECRFVLAGYPVWKAFVEYRDSNIWVESYFRIDVSKRIIFFAKAKAKTQKELKENSILDQLICDDIEIERKRIEDFFSTVPPNIIQAVSKFPDSHWEAIETIILLGPDILSLINSNPVLAYIIINSKKINPSIRLLNETEVLKRMILTKQKEVLSRCGFPETNQMVNIFAKIDPAFISVNDLVSLRNLLMIESQLKQRLLNVLSFAKTIDQNLLKLIIYNSPLLDFLDNKIIYELTKSDLFSQYLITIKKLYLNSKRWKLPFPRLISSSSINKAFEKQSTVVEKKRLKEDSFPPPPLEDNFYITAICQKSDLVSWSNRQRNCIRNYVSSIRSWQKYFYKVICGIEEATLELKISNGNIIKGDLLGAGNANVSLEMKQIVDEWFKDAKKNKVLKE